MFRKFKSIRFLWFLHSFYVRFGVERRRIYFRRLVFRDLCARVLAKCICFKLNLFNQSSQNHIRICNPPKRMCNSFCGTFSVKKKITKRSSRRKNLQCEHWGTRTRRKHLYTCERVKNIWFLILWSVFPKIDTFTRRGHKCVRKRGLNVFKRFEQADTL